jgi:hypothetical protein
VAAFKEGKISEQTAMVYSVNKSTMRRDLDIAKKEMGPIDDSPSDFKLDRNSLHHAVGSTPRPI